MPQSLNFSIIRWAFRWQISYIFDTCRPQLFDHFNDLLNESNGSLSLRFSWARTCCKCATKISYQSMKNVEENRLNSLSLSPPSQREFRSIGTASPTVRKAKELITNGPSPQQVIIYIHVIFIRFWQELKLGVWYLDLRCSLKLEWRDSCFRDISKVCSSIIKSERLDLEL
jgi:hypothetical protein